MKILPSLLTPRLLRCILRYLLHCLCLGLLLCTLPNRGAWAEETPSTPVPLPLNLPQVSTSEIGTPPASASAKASASSTAAPAPTLNSNTKMQHSTSGGMANLLQVVGALMLVIIVLLGLAWVLKNHGPKHLLGRVPVRVVGGVNIGGRERVLVIEVADQWIVIGATPNQITPITTLPRQNMAEDNEVPSKQFSVWLKQMMEKRNG
jgi:flagellar protein FliO/FliZ